MLSTSSKPTIAFVIPETVPVNVGEANGAFKSKAVCVAVETGLSASDVLSTSSKPTIAFVIPETFPVNVGEIALTTSPVPVVAISSTTPALPLPVKLPNTLPAATF